MKNFLEIVKYETVDSSTIKVNVYPDGGESEFLFFSQVKENGLNISDFYAKCVKYYYSSHLNYKDKEAQQDYIEFYGELPDALKEVSKSEAISLVKDWWGVLSLDPEDLRVHLSKFTSKSEYVEIINLNDEFNMLVETEDEFIFIYTLI